MSTQPNRPASRFPAHTPETVSGRSRETLAPLWQRHGDDLSVMVRTMAGSPAVLEGYLGLRRAMKRSAVPRRQSEQIALAIQQRLGCEECLAAHTAAGLAAGLDDAEVAMAREGAASDPREAALIAYAIGVHENPAGTSEATIDELRSLGYTDQQLLDVVGLVSLNHLTGSFNLVTGIRP
jgi:AhpD family alkylhydroperoxidase